MSLQEDENHVVKVLHNADGEVVAIFIQLEKQRKHLLIEDNNGDGQPVAKFFIKEETTEAISACLKVFSEVRTTIVPKLLL